MKLHIISDIHLEFCQSVTKLEHLLLKNPLLFSGILSPLKDETHDLTLILAGDIGSPLLENYWEFLEDCATKYANVICVSGNHEYFNSYNSKRKYTIDEINMIIRNRSSHIEEKYHNLFFLLQNSVTIDGITFLGTTLWTEIVGDIETIQSKITDYKCIFTSPYEMFNATTSTEIHYLQLEWLKKNITDNCVVITHHLPTKLLSHPKYFMFSDINCAYWSNLDDMFCDKIKMWICGHTHTPMEYNHESGTFLMTNPMGYSGENRNSHMREFDISSQIGHTNEAHMATN